jgi:hypothetical protein
MARRTFTRLLGATLALGGCGDDGAGSTSTTSTGASSSGTTGDTPTGVDATGSTGADPTTSGGTMAVSATEGVTTEVPTSTGGESTSSSEGTSSGGGTSSSSSEGTSTSSSSSEGSSGEDSSSGGMPVNLLKNPSVEDWMMAEEPNTTPDEWINCSNGGIAVDAVPDSCVADPVVGTDGARYARAFSGEGIGQTIPTISGHMYAISFDFTAVDGCFGSMPSAAFEVLVDGVLLMTTPANAVPMWSGADMMFMAAANTTDLCFRKTSDGGQGGLDNLAVFDQG